MQHGWLAVPAQEKRKSDENLTQGKNVLVRPKTTAPFIFLDEGSSAFGFGTLSASNMAFARNANPDRMIVTQAFYQPKGKKARFLSSAVSERTGLPMKSLPKKFIPAQVVRRQISK
jgi:hypothetical protein